jgi:small-conductance mechanosensitive channel
MRYSIVGVAYRENVDRVMVVLREIGSEISRDPHFRRLILEPLEVAGVDRLAESAVVIKARIKTRPLKQWEVSREFNRRLKNRFDELGIEIPFPRHTIHFAADKAGKAAPAPVRVETAALEPTDRLGRAAAPVETPAAASGAAEGTTERPAQSVFAPSHGG